MDPMTMAALASAASSLFSKKPSYDPNQRQMMDIAGQLKQYANGVPGSDPAEMAQLAQSRGQLGAEQAMQTQSLLGAMPANAQTNQLDFLKNLGGSQAADRSNLFMQYLLDAMNKRKQALLQSAQVYGSVGPKGGGHQSELPTLLGQLAYQQAQAKAAGGGQGSVGAQSGGQGGGFPQTAGAGGRMTFPGMGNGQTVAAQGIVPATPAPQSGMLGAFGSAFGQMTQPNVPGSFFTGASRPGQAGYSIGQFTQPPAGSTPDWATDPLSRRLRGG